MKLIFLDIDGVLNSHRSIIALGSARPNDIMTYDKLDKVAIELVKDVVKQTEAKAILSSTWRILLRAVEQYQLERVLGFKLFGMTPITAMSRGREIDVVLNKLKPKAYIIIDDDSDFMNYQKPYHVRVDVHNGFSYENYKLCLELLK